MVTWNQYLCLVSDKNNLSLYVLVLYTVALLYLTTFDYNSRSRKSREVCILDIHSIRTELLNTHLLLTIKLYELATLFL